LAEVTFGEWLKRQRKAAGLTQEQLAQQVSCSTITLRKIEGEERRPSAQIVERLAEIFNIPQNEQSAFLRFARGDWKSTPTTVPEDVPWRVSAVSPRSNLPASLTSLIGREHEIASVHEYLWNPSIRLVTLIGPPGIGKTRLSIEAARTELSDFPDGVFLIALAPLEDPNFIAPTIAQTLGFAEATDQSPIKRLANGIGNKQMLLVLDNAEHIIEGTATLVSDLLSACPRLKILTTSREALRVPGEWLYPVPALSIPAETQLQSIDIATAMQFAALSLFVERARAVRSDFALNVENVRVVASICTQLDGLPLAIELIAARVRLMSPQSLLPHLSDQFTLYADGVRAVSARQKTLYNAIGWSYDLLPAKEQVLFRRLAAFAGGWTLEAAQAVCSGEGLEANEVPDLLMHLVDKSLVIVQEEKGAARYQLLEIIRQFSREKLWAAGEGEIMRQRHLAYFVDLAEQAEPNLRAFDMLIWLDRLEVELDNIRAALAWAQESDVEAELRLASALLWFWHIRGHRNEGVDWLERGLLIEAVESSNQSPTPDRAMIRGKALNAAGFLLILLGELNKGALLSNESVALFQELGPAGKRGLAYALHNLGHDSRQQQDTRQAKISMKASLILFQEVGDKFGMAQCLAFLGGPWEEDPYVRVRMLQEGLALYQEIGDKDGIAITFMLLGDLAFRQVDYKQATIWFEESLALFREVRNKVAMSLVLRWLGQSTRAQGDYGRATTILEEALALGQELGDKFPIASSYDDLGLVAQSQGEYKRATQLHERALTLFHELGNKHAASYTTSHLGFAALAWGDDQQAGKKFEQALAVSREAESKFGVAFALYGLGRAMQSQGDYALTSNFYREAIVIFREISDSAGVAYCLEGFAVLVINQNQIESPVLSVENFRRSARLFGAAEALYPPLRFEISAAERAEHDRSVSAARAALGEESFAAAWAEGRAMTMEQAIAYALEHQIG
jgi:predicted ATPase/transcriptional regulator with XRE-family HTH domain